MALNDWYSVWQNNKRMKAPANAERHHKQRLRDFKRDAEDRSSWQKSFT